MENASMVAGGIGLVEQRGAEEGPQPAIDIVMDRLARLLREEKRMGGVPSVEQRYVLPIPVSVSWGKIVSAVLVGNLLTAILLAIAYAVMR